MHSRRRTRRRTSQHPKVCLSQSLKQAVSLNASLGPHPNEASPGASPSVSLSQAPTPGPSKPSASPAPTTTRRDSTPAGKPRDGPRSAKTEGVKFDFLKDPTRDKCMELVFEALVFDSQARASPLLARHIGGGGPNATSLACSL